LGALGHGLRRAERFDGWGAVLLMPALTGLLLAINEGRRWGWTAPLTLGCAIGGLILLGAFVWRERTYASPLLDLRLLRIPPFAAGNVAGLLAYGLLFGLFFLLPFALERGYRETPLVAGLLLTAVPVALGLVAPFSGRASEVVGPYPLTVTGMLVAAGALLALALLLGSGAGLVPVVLVLVAFGLGQGLFTAPNNSAIMGAAPPERLGVAGGVLNVTRTLGTSLGVALATVVFALRLAARAGGAVSTTHAPHAAVLGSIHDTLLLFAALAVVAAGISLVRGGAASASPPAGLLLPHSLGRRQGAKPRDDQMPRTRRATRSLSRLCIPRSSVARVGARPKTA
jgi:MFS family permease